MGQHERVRAWMGIGSAIGAVVVLLAIAAAVVPGRMLDRAPGEGADGHTHAPAPAALGYAESVARVQDLVTQLDSALAVAKAGDADRTAQLAYEAAQVAQGIGRAALADPVVPREKVKEANLAGKAVAAAADDVHQSLDAGRLDEAKTRLPALKEAVARLGQVAPERYVCEMHCEGTKTYERPGKCPVCAMALTPIGRTPWYAKVTAEGAVEAGKPCDLRIELLDPLGKPAGGLDVVHEHPLHFMLLSDDLSFYAHEHPERQADGAFLLRGFTFPFGGRFVAFADFTPTGKANQVSRSEFRVASGSVPEHSPVPLAEDYDGVGKDGDYEFRVRCNGDVFYASRDSFLRYGLDLKGEPVRDLEPLMGAMGHLVIVSQDFKHYVHAHPLDFDGVEHPGIEHHHQDPALLERGRKVLYGNGTKWDVVFHAVFPEPGRYRAFAQFKHHGKVLTYAVTIDASPAPADGEEPITPSSMPAGHTHAR